MTRSGMEHLTDRPRRDAVRYVFVVATTQYGPANFPLAIRYGAGETLQDAMRAELNKRGLIVCCDYYAERIGRDEYMEVTR